MNKIIYTLLSFFIVTTSLKCQEKKSRQLSLKISFLSESYGLPIQNIIKVPFSPGIEYGETENGIEIGHSGLIDGYLTHMYYFPDNDFTYISFTNGASIDLWNLRNDLREEATKILFE